MSAETLHIKNMVCRRCVMAVEDACRDAGIDGAKVALGSVEFAALPDEAVLVNLFERLRQLGFEPLQKQEQIMLEKIKASVRFYARNSWPEPVDGKLSDYICRSVNTDFRYASRMFSQLEGRTIQSYLMQQRVEYVKELLSDNQLTLAEIADRAGFSSVAHLSRVFKNVEGMTISRFRIEGFPRTGIDEV